MLRGKIIKAPRACSDAHKSVSSTRTSAVNPAGSTHLWQVQGAVDFAVEDICEKLACKGRGAEDTCDDHEAPNLCSSTAAANSLLPHGSPQGGSDQEHTQGDARCGGTLASPNSLLAAGDKAQLINPDADSVPCELSLLGMAVAGLVVGLGVAVSAACANSGSVVRNSGSTGSDQAALAAAAADARALEVEARGIGDEVFLIRCSSLMLASASRPFCILISEASCTF